MNLVFEMNENHLKYRPDIDGLRAVAVILVIAFHTKLNTFSGGFVGVDIFFVISGYLITSIIYKQITQKKFSFIEFYTKRVHRIFPALTLMLLIVWFCGYFILIPAEFSALGKHIRSSALFINNFTLAGESGYFDTAAETKPLLHLWSLGIEEQFYFIWPIVLMGLIRFKFKLKTSLLILGLILLVACAYFVKSDPSFTFYFPLLRFWELLAGGILAISNPFNKFSTFQGILGSILIMFSSISFNSNTTFPGLNALVPVVGACLIISAGPQSWINKNFLSRHLVVKTGLISYPLYLWHWPLIVFSLILYPDPTNKTPIYVSILLSFLLAYLTNKFIEKKTRAVGKSYSKSVLICLGLFSTGFLGHKTLTNYGFPDRYGSELKPLAHFKFDRKVPWRVGKCFLLAEQKFESFAPECLDQIRENKREIIYLWGDSFAAALSPGLRQIYSNHFRIAQYTASACPPLINFSLNERPFCKSINDANLRRIRELKPKILMLMADWREFHLSYLMSTLELLKKEGINQIIIVGPVPQWRDGLPRVAFRLASQDANHKVPERSKSYLLTEMFAVDALMKIKLSHSKVKYVSSIAKLCNENGCLIRTSDSQDSLTAQDVGHLTSAGAIYLFKQFYMDKIIK